MKIVILDAFTANPGDLSWEALAALGELISHERTPAAQIVERARDAEIVLTNKTPLNAETIAALPRLRYLGVLATGHNVVDVAAARARGIPVCNVPAYGTASVAQAVFALLLELTNRTGQHAQAVRAGRWSTSPDWCFWDGELIELAGRTLGVVGVGEIGRAVGGIGRAFGMRVLGFSRRGVPGMTSDDGAEWVTLETLFRESDVVSLHCPLTPETRGLVSAARLARMRPGAFLLNTARGPLVNEADLAAALHAGRIAGAGLDVLSVEPPAAENPLLRAPNCLVTPHIAWATRAARARLIETAAGNVRAFLAGAPRNVVG